jgi:hypothetical protein
MKSLAAALCAILMASCAGYHLGTDKPAPLSAVKSIAVPMMTNETLHPRAEILATSELANAITTDGTYRLAAATDADAVLVAAIKEIRYEAIRSRRLDTLRPEELSNTVVIGWELRDGRDPKQVLISGSSQGSSQLFADTDLQTARNNALPDALARACVGVVSTLANGF